MSWHYEDGMLVVTAAVPAERGALVIKALQKIVDARTDEREAYYQALLAGGARYRCRGGGRRLGQCRTGGCRTHRRADGA